MLKPEFDSQLGIEMCVFISLYLLFIFAMCIIVMSFFEEVLDEEIFMHGKCVLFSYFCFIKQTLE